MTLSITPSHLPFYSVLTFFCGVVCLSQGIFVLTKNHKNLTNQLYFYFCIAICIWLFSISLLSSKLFSDHTSLVLGRWVYTGVVFMPTLALHFATSFVKNELKSKPLKRDLIIAYSFTFVFLVLVWTSNSFISGTYNYSWGFYPKGGVFHAIHTTFVLGTAFYAIHLLHLALTVVRNEHGKTNRYHEIKYLFLAMIFVTCGSSDFLHNWGIDFFPVGCIFAVLFVTFTMYGIFRHGVMGISIVIRKSLAYSILVSIIATLYFTIVYLTATFVGGLAKAHSAPVILLILTVITLLFKPLERKIQSFVDLLIFKKTPEELQKENDRLIQEVQKTEQMKTVATLAAGMAHEIKNPLTSIKTFAEYLPEKYDDPGFREKFKKIVVDEVDRVNNIVKQLLEFSKPQELELKPCSMASILDDTLSLLGNNLLKNKIELVKKYSRDITLLVDKNQLRQAFLNLFLNSIQAMPDGGTLTVSISDSMIIISDTGVGIPKENISHLFDPFFTTKEEGTGLGLSIVHSIISKHGGKMEVKSKLGAGTEISVILKNRS